ncbi:hypothetical protein [Spartinivicinus poritis]|uniref:Lipoprotein n=1 Tax=Spartinivicinus poritis TaxID=2994640 RepID=A0ABT5U3A9_9GAMM|nr:hypothetical protein [Spartinivicinus sp. A2-2]MDE1460850.1 hypothetical protein [Spartinivicinus sp. A2-2]
MKNKSVVAIILLISVFLASCSARHNDRQQCASLVNTTWERMDIAKAEGFAGTLSYSKAVGLLSLAKTAQAVEKFQSCIKHANKALYYVDQSRQGQ